MEQIVKKYWLGPLVVVAGFVAAPAVSAQTCSDSSVAAAGCTVEVKGVAITPVTVAAPQTTTVAARQQLPVTGSDVITLSGVGAALVLGGALLVRRSRSGIEQR